MLSPTTSSSLDAKYRLFDSAEQHGKVHPDPVVGEDNFEKPGWASDYSDKGMVTALRKTDYVWAKKLHLRQHPTPMFWSSFQ
jgi:hypothetical protein